MRIKYVSEITKEELEDNVVIQCMNEDNFPCIIVKNSENKIIIKNISTDNLEIKENLVLDCESKKYFVHIIRSKMPISKDFNIIYDYVFNSIKSPIDDEHLDILVNTIDEYFHITPESEKEMLQIGVYGELLTVKSLYDYGFIEIVDKYHQNFFSKHDVEVSKDVRLEIKTSGNEKRIHNFKHNQIQRDDVDVYVASSIIEKSSEGKSLYELTEEIKTIYTDPNARFELEKLMKRCGVSEDKQGIKVSYQKALNDLKYYQAIDLPRIKDEIPAGITNVQYDVDCATAKEFNIKDLINLFNKEIGKN